MTRCPIHDLVGPDLESIPPTVSCEVCGYTEEADPYDVARQLRALVDLGYLTPDEATDWARGLYGDDWGALLSGITGGGR